MANPEAEKLLEENAHALGPPTYPLRPPPTPMRPPPLPVASRLVQLLLAALLLLGPAAAQVVQTLAGGGAGGGTLSGSTDGDAVTSARYAGPRGVAVDTSGNVIVADTLKIRTITPSACLPGSYLPPSMFYCAPCPSGTFSNQAGATSCAPCPAGKACAAGTSSWALRNCGRGSYCPEGSSAPTPCPIQLPPPPYASWAQHPSGVQGPAFLVDTAACANHCFWNFTSGDGQLSVC
jgi:hypothetical protein